MKLFIVSFLTTLLLVTTQRIRCESFCKFRFCQNLLRAGPKVQPENRALLLGIPKAALGPVPCLVRPSGTIQFLTNVTGGEAKISREFSLDRYVRISRFERRAVDPNFPETFFKWVDNENTGRVSIARRFPRGNQDQVIDQVCVRMPIKSYDLRRKDGSLRKRVVTKGTRSCVSFRTQIPILLVDFEWTTTNDFDLRLVEPNGFEINRFGGSLQSPNGGRLIADIGGSICQVEFGREQIRYLQKNAVVEPGTYTIRVDHLRECSPSSRYKLRVYYMGRVLLSESGNLSGLGESILVRRFDVSG